jgi:hypothetical protein
MLVAIVVANSQHKYLLKMTVFNRFMVYFI